MSARSALLRTALAVILLLQWSCSEGTSQRRERGPVLLVQPLGAVPSAHVDSVVRALQREYRARVHIAPSLPLPEQALTTVRTPRYRADTLIVRLRGIKPDTIDHIIGLTEADISHTKRAADGTIKEPRSKYQDFGIFGLGYVNGPSCVISTFRLGDDGEQRFFDRLCKIAVHEVGHNRGLPHCPEQHCVMRDAVERIASIDGTDRFFCLACRGRSGEGMVEH